MNHESIIKDFQKIAKQHIEKDGGHSAMMLAINGEQISGIVLDEVMNDKDMIAAIINRTRKIASCVILITEAWTSILNKRDIMEGMEIISPSQNPDRIEVLMMSVYENNQSTMYTAKIIRNGNCATLDQWEKMGDGGEGRFSATEMNIKDVKSTILNPSVN
jgi:hypothetical protein